MAHKMLKRLSFTSESPAPAQLVPPAPSFASAPNGGGPSSPGGRRSIDSVSPSFRASSSSYAGSGYPFPPQAPRSPGGAATLDVPGAMEPSPPAVERPALHRSLAALSALLVAFDDLRDAVARTGQAERRLAKAMKEVAASFGSATSNGSKNGTAESRGAVIVNALASPSSMLESLGETTNKLSRQVQKEYESANDCAGKFFKSVAKHEKAFDDSVAQLEGKMQKASMAYERNLPRTRMLDPVSAAMDHDKYMTAIASLSAQVNALKASHAEKMGIKREAAVKEVAGCLCQLAEASWRNRVDATRAAAPKVGDVIAKGIWCHSGMPATTYGYDEDETDVMLATAAPVQDDAPSTVSSTAYVKGPRPLPGSSSSASFVDTVSSRSDAYRASEVSSHVSSRAIDSPRMHDIATRHLSASPQKGMIGRMALQESQVDAAEPTRPPMTNQVSFKSAPGSRQLERSDTTASERSFVAKMKEKYSQDKAAARAALQTPSEQTTTNDSEASQVSSIASPHETVVAPQPTISRSDSRVRLLAQQWSSFGQDALPSPSSPRAATFAGRPTHKHSLSMQPLTTSSNEFGQRVLSPEHEREKSSMPLPPPPRRVPPVVERRSLPEDQEVPIEEVLEESKASLVLPSPPLPIERRSSAVIHADVCQCDDCAAKQAR